jgi:hypothetical protein
MTEFYSAPSPFAWRKFTILYTALQTAALTNSVLILALPPKTVIHRAILNVTQAFSGTTTLTLSLGTVGDNVKFAVAQSVLSTGLLNGVALTAPLPESMSASTNVSIYAISTVQNLSSLSQGSVDVYVLASTMP